MRGINSHQLSNFKIRNKELSTINQTNSIIDMIKSYNLTIQTDILSYSQSRNAIASKRFFNINKYK